MAGKHRRLKSPPDRAHSHQQNLHLCGLPSSKCMMRRLEAYGYSRANMSVRGHYTPSEWEEGIRSFVSS